MDPPHCPDVLTRRQGGKGSREVLRCRLRPSTEIGRRGVDATPVSFDRGADRSPNAARGRRSADVLVPQMPYGSGPCRCDLPSRPCAFPLPTLVEPSARGVSTRSSFTVTSRPAGVSTPSAAAADSHWVPPSTARPSRSARTGGFDRQIHDTTSGIVHGDTYWTAEGQVRRTGPSRFPRRPMSAASQQQRRSGATAFAMHLGVTLGERRLPSFSLDRRDVTQHYPSLASIALRSSFAPSTYAST